MLIKDRSYVIKKHNKKMLVNTLRKYSLILVNVFTNIIFVLCTINYI